MQIIFFFSALLLGGIACYGGRHEWRHRRDALDGIMMIFVCAMLGCTGLWLLHVVMFGLSHASGSYEDGSPVLMPIIMPGGGTVTVPM